MALCPYDYGWVMHWCAMQTLFSRGRCLLQNLGCCTVPLCMSLQLSACSQSFANPSCDRFVKHQATSSNRCGPSFEPASILQPTAYSGMPICLDATGTTCQPEVEAASRLSLPLHSLPRHGYVCKRQVQVMPDAQVCLQPLRGEHSAGDIQHCSPRQRGALLMSL